jgi:glucokinase
MILAGDVGGTKSDLALFDPGRPLDPVGRRVLASRDFPSLADVLAAFLGEHPATLDAVCLGVPGPVLGDTVKATNLPWTIHVPALRDRLDGAPVFLLNDLEAFAWGLATLPEDRFAVLQPGAAGASGNAAVIAAGTGLGEAGLVWDGRRHLPFAAEGGHADFAPRTEEEIALLRHLRARFEHVSCERVVSGPGLVNIVHFLHEAEGLQVPPALVGDDPAAVTTAAFSGSAPIASRALDLFVSAYGAEAGNLALKLKATGGVYVGGGIAPKILPKLQDGTFRAAFVAKGRFAEMLAAIPVRVVLELRTALFGALRYASERLARR